MNQNLTDINIVLDRSGSMTVIKNDMEGGLNAFLEEQKKVEGEATVSLYQFDHEFEESFIAKDIKEVSKIVLEPRGTTALLDAMGRSILTTGRRLAAMKEEDRPSKVIMIIITDGGENASDEFTREKVFELIKQQEETYSWEFVFLGANQDAVGEAAKYGIAASKAMTFDYNKSGVDAVAASLSSSMTSYRAGGCSAMAFSDEQKAAANKDGA